MLLYAFTHFYMLLLAFTCFYPLCKLSSSQDHVVGLVKMKVNCSAGLHLRAAVCVGVRKSQFQPNNKL